jgi:hypothetical protein
MRRLRMSDNSHLDGLMSLEPGKACNGLANFLLSYAEFIEALEIEPELGAGAKEMGEAQGGIARYGTRAIQDLGDAIGGDVEFACELSGAHAEGFEFFGEVFTGMDSWY